MTGAVRSGSSGTTSARTPIPRSYPCHVCKDTMVNGHSFSIPRVYPDVLPVDPALMNWADGKPHPPAQPKGEK